MIGRCTICGDNDVEVRHLEIYVTGSEGCECCEDCGIALSGHARQMMLVAAKASKRGYKAARQVAEAKQEHAQQLVCDMIPGFEEGMRNCESDAEEEVEGARQTYDGYCEIHVKAWAVQDEMEARQKTKPNE